MGFSSGRAAVAVGKARRRGATQRSPLSVNEHPRQIALNPYNLHEPAAGSRPLTRNRLQAALSGRASQP